MQADQTCEDATDKSLTLERAVRTVGGIARRAAAGQTVFSWQSQPKAFVLLTSGKLTVQFRTRGRRVPWAECRATGGEDCMPVTAAILSGRDIDVRAVATAPCSWIELPPADFMTLVHGPAGFRRALFAQHARRLPHFFARITSKNAVTLDQRIAEWLLGHAKSGQVAATHDAIAADLITAREVVSRRLRDFARKGWIVQRRGTIDLVAPGAMSRLSRNAFMPGLPNTWAQTPGAGE